MLYLDLKQPVIMTAILALLISCGQQDTPDEDPEGLLARFELNEDAFSPLQQTGGWVVTSVTPKEAQSRQSFVLLIRDSETQIVGFNNFSPFLNLPLAGGLTGLDRNEKHFIWNEKDQLTDTRHTVVYDAQGRRISNDPRDTPDIRFYDVRFDKESGKGEIWLPEEQF